MSLNATGASIEALAEIDRLTTQLTSRPDVLKDNVRIASLHLDDNKPQRSKPYAMHAIELFHAKKKKKFEECNDLVDLLLKFWKTEKHSVTVKGDLRLNLTSERDDILNNIEKVMISVMEMKDDAWKSRICLKMAYVRETRGEFQASLALLSELIAVQAVDGVDLSYIIFKAAIILKHLGQPKQSIEYLEFILDDPPLQDGFMKSHVYAFLTLVYEQSGDKYKVFLPKAYKELYQAFLEDNPTNKLLKVPKSKFGQTSELWEMYALQSLDRCEYVMAAQFLAEAINKAPGKAKLLHLQAEVYALMKQNSVAAEYAEQAYELTPQSNDLRNLLLHVNPSKWQDKLRKVAATTKGASNNDLSMDLDEGAGAMYAPPTKKERQQAKAAAAAGVLLNTSPVKAKPSAATTGTTGMGMGKSVEAEDEAMGGGGEEEEEGARTWLGKVAANAGKAIVALDQGKALPMTEDKLKAINKEKGDKQTGGSGGGGGGAGTGAKRTKAHRIHKKKKDEAEEDPDDGGDEGEDGEGTAAAAGGGGGKNAKKKKAAGGGGFMSGIFGGGGKKDDAAGKGAFRAGLGGSMKNLISQVSPGGGKQSNSRPSSPDKATAAAEGADSKSPNKARAKTPPKPKSKSPKPRRATKYDLTPSVKARMAEAGKRVPHPPPGRPAKPALSKQAWKVLDIVHRGGDKIHIYDPNLKVLQEMWAISRREEQAKAQAQAQAAVAVNEEGKGAGEGAAKEQQEEVVDGATSSSNRAQVTATS